MWNLIGRNNYEAIGNIFSVCTKYITENTISLITEIVLAKICISVYNLVCTTIINDIYKNEKEWTIIATKKSYERISLIKKKLCVTS